MNGDKMVVTKGISCSGEPYMSIYQPSSLKSIKSENRNVGRLLLDYMPTFFIIATWQKSVLEGYRNLISLQSVNLYGNVTLWLNKFNISPLSAKEKVNFVKHLTSCLWAFVKGCKKSSKETKYELLDRGLRLDPRTFTFLYLVEEFQDNIIDRIR